MNEREKMLSGQLYDAMSDKTLIEERMHCKKLCYKYNGIPPENMEERDKVIKKIIGKTGKKVLIEQSFQCDYGYNIELGENFYSNHNLVILDPAKVSFGDNCFVGPNCSFCTPEHPIDAATRNKGLEYAYPIKVGNNVWFGANVTVTGGVTIGDNAVIGAGSLVVKDIPENSVAVGNPCRVIKSIKNNE